MSLLGNNARHNSLSGRPAASHSPSPSPYPCDAGIAKMTVQRSYKDTKDSGTQTNNIKFLRNDDMCSHDRREEKVEKCLQPCQDRILREVYHRPQMYNYGNPVFTCDSDVVERYATAGGLQEQKTWEWGQPHNRRHPLYRTTNSIYGALPPTVHAMPVTSFPINGKFLEHLCACGMYRNTSLNTVMDKSFV